ncbi:hypothetical protein PAPYR_3812 [Paratrimastix pyriformis]|uniref:Mon2 C-terminal domain-containing protein n=1 Tax=Paratrimastix pyriformis TaxID=342808 RepID=A0ABQ8UMP9_9EUKA|nr:hypothetical protein PAPYR_3812 [Paratrimastix pyriformis]
MRNSAIRTFHTALLSLQPVPGSPDPATAQADLAEARAPAAAVVLCPYLVPTCVPRCINTLLVPAAMAVWSHARNLHLHLNQQADGAPRTDEPSGCRGWEWRPPRVVGAGGVRLAVGADGALAGCGWRFLWVGPQEGLLLHHSRNTPQKQWDETNVLVIDGLGRAIRVFSGPLAQAGVLTTTAETIIGSVLHPAIQLGREEVARAALEAANEILRLADALREGGPAQSAEGATPALGERLWERVWSTVEQAEAVATLLTRWVLPQQLPAQSPTPSASPEGSPSPSPSPAATPIIIIIDGLQPLTTPRLNRPADQSTVVRIAWHLARAVHPNATSHTMSRFTLPSHTNKPQLAMHQLRFRQAADGGFSEAALRAAHNFTETLNGSRLQSTHRVLLEMLAIMVPPPTPAIRHPQPPATHSRHPQPPPHRPPLPNGLGLSPLASRAHACSCSACPQAPATPQVAEEILLALCQMVAYARNPAAYAEAHRHHIRFPYGPSGPASPALPSAGPRRSGSSPTLRPGHMRPLPAAPSASSTSSTDEAPATAPPRPRGGALPSAEDSRAANFFLRRLYEACALTYASAPAAVRGRTFEQLLQVALPSLNKTARLCRASLSLWLVVVLRGLPCLPCLPDSAAPSGEPRPTGRAPWTRHEGWGHTLRVMRRFLQGRLPPGAQPSDPADPEDPPAHHTHMHVILNQHRLRAHPRPAAFLASFPPALQPLLQAGGRPAPAPARWRRWDSLLLEATAARLLPLALACPPCPAPDRHSPEGLARLCGPESVLARLAALISGAPVMWAEAQQAAAEAHQARDPQAESPPAPAPAEGRQPAECGAPLRGCPSTDSLQSAASFTPSVAAPPEDGRPEALEAILDPDEPDEEDLCWAVYREPPPCPPPACAGDGAGPDGAAEETPGEGAAEAEVGPNLGTQAVALLARLLSAPHPAGPADGAETDPWAKLTAALAGHEPLAPFITEADLIPLAVWPVFSRHCAALLAAYLAAPPRPSRPWGGAWRPSWTSWPGWPCPGLVAAHLQGDAGLLPAGSLLDVARPPALLGPEAAGRVLCQLGSRGCAHLSGPLFGLVVQALAAPGASPLIRQRAAALARRFGEALACGLAAP